MDYAIPSSSLAKLLKIMAQLRDPEGGCPWDIKQNFDSIAHYTIEEAYEVADAIARNDMPALKDELGDLLLQVVYHSRLAEEEDLFNFNDVTEAITSKMKRRHPHVFSDGIAPTDINVQTTVWENIKAEERRAKKELEPRQEKISVLDDIPAALPALKRAEKVQKRASQVGFDWEQEDSVISKIREEIDELEVEVKSNSPVERIRDELGDILFSVVNLSRRMGVDAESSLRHSTLKFDRRVRFMEDILQSDGRELVDASLAEMESLWKRAKTES